MIIVPPWPKAQLLPDDSEDAMMLYRSFDGIHLCRWFTDGLRIDKRLGSPSIGEFLLNHGLIPDEETTE